MFKKFFAGLMLFAVVICCGEPRADASPNDPTLGGCVIMGPDGLTCKLSAHPTVIQPLSAIDLKTGTLSYGLQAVSPGLCYGVTYGPTEWYASGASFCLNVGKIEGGNVVFPSGVVQLVKWAQVGMGGMCADGNSTDGSKLVCHALVLFGVNIPIE